MNRYNRTFENIGIYFSGPNQDDLKKGSFQVSCSKEEKKSFYTERTLRIQHKVAGEQFIYCHGCVSEYLRSFNVYANFNEATGKI
ncbi:hypothetical protein MAR_032469 [Mya arenaria]|uniref:Uncharacterized protein n=1 Tax=Mya arenaria TaxID=6604 RepID=A0ABY7F7E3_MYAAR|nr:hypothetical protein MAR_032469 [Mya arenaria]